MKSIRDWLAALRKGKSVPVIQSPYGPVTESARLQAAVNMRLRPDVKERVILDIMMRKRVARPFAEVIAKERYPEAFED